MLRCWLLVTIPGRLIPFFCLCGALPSARLWSCAYNFKWKMSSNIPTVRSFLCARSARTNNKIHFCFRVFVNSRSLAHTRTQFLSSASHSPNEKQNKHSEERVYDFWRDETLANLLCFGVAQMDEMHRKSVRLCVKRKKDFDEWPKWKNEQIIMK